MASFWLHEQSVILFWVVIRKKSLVKLRPSNYWDVALPPSTIKLILVSSATEILKRCMHHNLSHTYTFNNKILFYNFSTQHMINLNMGRREYETLGVEVYPRIH